MTLIKIEINKSIGNDKPKRIKANEKSKPLDSKIIHDFIKRIDRFFQLVCLKGFLPESIRTRDLREGSSKDVPRP